MISHIIISDNFEAVKNELLIECDPNYLRIFEYENALSEDAKDIINEAYLAETKEKVIAVFAKKFNIQWQNSLLKILEEPPRNIVFIIVAPAKNLLIPTIRSRLILDNRLEFKTREKCELDLDKLDLKSIYEFLDIKDELAKKGEFDRNSLEILVKNIICDCLDKGIKFQSDELEYFDKLYKLSLLNSRPNAILTPLLLLILKKIK